MALVEPHVPWVMGDPPNTLLKKFTFHPILQIPSVREDFSRYLAEITYMDSQVVHSWMRWSMPLRRTTPWSCFPRNRVLNFLAVNGPTGMPVCIRLCLPDGLDTFARSTHFSHRSLCGCPSTLIDLAGGEMESRALDGWSFTEVYQGRQRPIAA